MAFHARWVRWAVMLLLFIPAVQSLFRRLRDPLGHFCGKEDCYEVLNVTRNMTKDDIRQSYRALSRVHHPDKGGDAQRFAQISKAYNVFMNETRREEYDFYILDYPDAYSKKYGRRMLYSYAAQSNLIVVLAGLLAFTSIIVVAFQHNRHTNAVTFICIAAEKNLSPQKGGWPVSALIRKMAEERIKQGSPSSEDKQRSKGSKSNRKAKQKRSTEVTVELQLEIRNCAEEIELLGEFAAVNWRHVPILQCYKWPYQIFNYATYFHRWVLWHFFGGGHEKNGAKTPLSNEDSEFWICRLIDRDIWETISVEMQNEAIAHQVWMDEGAMGTWKRKVGLTANGIIRMKPQDKGKID